MGGLINHLRENGPDWLPMLGQGFLTIIFAVLLVGWVGMLSEKDKDWKGILTSLGILLPLGFLMYVVYFLA